MGRVEYKAVAYESIAAKVASGRPFPVQLVSVDGRRTGRIMRAGSIYFYKPTGSGRGASFTTVTAVMRSLDAA